MLELIPADLLAWELPHSEIVPGLDDDEHEFLYLMRQLSIVKDRIHEKNKRLVKAFEQGGAKPWDDPFTEEIDDMVTYLVGSEIFRNYS